ncbi:orotate phosphoribosyltransferase [Synechococcus sp. PCC 6312]|uniref:orotate phosphoribosyltransferase n=1 Tax=Synechococcus sp. (strain ATCC 27167 / PCC 6312) TaxID=195253 RepID=UPI00029F35F3|nr:orotate phosphoribosyltransferase [Synechococcus sp. PCC 6312]AFY60147.1 orotate phosphoribosyltransferase [Synechococcus sp. PCC 6312]
MTSELRLELLHLLRTQAYREGDFTLSSGQKSSYYINCKPVTLSARGALLVGRLLLAELPPSTQAVAGLTLGADPIVTAVSVVSAYEYPPAAQLPALIIRKETKSHGTRAYIEGPVLAAGTEIAVLEDVVTTGGSALKAVERLREAGYGVKAVLGIVDRDCGGEELFASYGLAFKALFTIRDFQTR